MKRNHLKLLLVAILIIVACLVNIFVPGIKLFTEVNINYILLWGAILGILIAIMGIEKNRSQYQIDALQVVFIYCITYLIATYIFGFFFGFIKSPYSLEFIKIIKNILPVIAVITLQELIRYQFTSKGKGNIFIVLLITSIFVAFDITIAYKYFQFTNSMELYEFIGTVVIASIARNLILTYMSSKTGYKATMMYRFLFEVPLYLIPIFPDLGLYLKSLLDVVFPAILFLKLNVFFANFKPVPRTARVKKMRKFLIMAPTYTFVIIVFVLISGLFKIYGMAVVSNSMKPAFSRGDMIIVEKLNDKEIDNLKEGDILAYYYDGRIVTHRIHEIKVDKKNNKSFYTKGDNNDDADNWEIKPNIIKGKVRYKIPYVGYPSVWLFDLTG